MAQMWLSRRPKGTSTATAATKTRGVDNTSVTTTTAAAAAAASTADNSPQNCCCGCIARIVKKLKKQGRMLRAAAAAGANRHSPNFQCRYDPLSYSLNFDPNECGSLLDDGDYYQFCAFSSRFVANPRTSCTPTLVLATSH